MFLPFSFSFGGATTLATSPGHRAASAGTEGRGRGGRDAGHKGKETEEDEDETAAATAANDDGTYSWVCQLSIAPTNCMLNYIIIPHTVHQVGKGEIEP